MSSGPQGCLGTRQGPERRRGRSLGCRAFSPFPGWPIVPPVCPTPVPSAASAEGSALRPPALPGEGQTFRANIPGPVATARRPWPESAGHLQWEAVSGPHPSVPRSSRGQCLPGPTPVPLLLSRGKSLTIGFFVEVGGPRAACELSAQSGHFIFPPPKGPPTHPPTQTAEGLSTPHELTTTRKPTD